ncbi:hypothetical protein [Peribacillus frigoritolerans]|uniref:hypothetical protein n=1 Tax=Peribacillus frigoritolerans TaxID=450367 RepID=UPI00301732CB
MNLEMWKWIFSQLPPHELTRFCNELQITVPGFRKGKINPSKINAINRLMFEKELLKKKNFEKFKMVNVKLQEPHAELDIETSDIDRLYQEVLEGVLPSTLFAKLLLENLEEKAVALFSSMPVDEWEQIETKNRSARKQDIEEKAAEAEYLESGTPSDSKNDEPSAGVRKKLESKIDNLTEELKKNAEQYKKKRQQLKVQLDQTVHALNQQSGENGQLTHQVSTLKAELEERQRTFERQLSERNRMIEEQKEVIQRHKDEIDSLHAMILTESKVKYEVPAPKSAILCIGNPFNEEIFDQDSIEVTILDRSDVTTFETEKEYEEIWVLTYKVSKREVDELLRVLAVPTVRYFDTFQRLENHLEKGYKYYAR